MNRLASALIVVSSLAVCLAEVGEYCSGDFWRGSFGVCGVFGEEYQLQEPESLNISALDR